MGEAVEQSRTRTRAKEKREKREDSKMFHVKQLLRNRIHLIDARAKTIKGMFHVKHLRLCAEKGGNIERFSRNTSIPAAYRVRNNELMNVSRETNCLYEKMHV